MKTIYLDGGAGISGNMFLGGLISLGLSGAFLKKELAKLPITLPEITINNVRRQGISAILIEVPDVHEQSRRNLDDISQLIGESKLKPEIAANALKIFHNLAEAEAKIHGTSIQAIHFHEVGALDAIIDIVGACIGLDYFEIQSVMVSPLRVGFGTITCAHGELPLPAPATIELLKEFKIFGGEIAGEWTTPTGAAIIKTLGVGTDSLPELRVAQAGYGAGTRDYPIPNVVRMILGETAEDSNWDDVQTILETNIDDMNPEIYGYLGELLLKAGARDYYLTPVQMKKGRPGALITVIVPMEKVGIIEEILFKETTTLGIRRYNTQRSCLERNQLLVTVRGVPVKIKTAFFKGQLIKYAPEYEDCLRVSRDLGCTLREIYEEAVFATRKILQNEGAS